jgi:hypothetical protein
MFFTERLYSHPCCNYAHHVCNLRIIVYNIGIFAFVSTLASPVYQIGHGVHNVSDDKSSKARWVLTRTAMKIKY